MTNKPYTPNMDEVRSVWAVWSEYGGLVNRPRSGLHDDRLQEFDRWLNQIKAEAWAEGWSEGLGVGRDDFNALSYDDNPYRTDQIGARDA